MASPATQQSPQRRAIGIIRVSQVGGREGERFVSPDEQRERIEAACERDGLALVAMHEELDVSGGRTLADRPGLSAAVAAIEAGHADVIAAAYFDRLFRSLGTQAEVIERVERAGGQVLAVDVGQVSNGSAGQWLSGTMLGAVTEYQRRSIRERSAEGQARAVARGATPWARVPLGYQRQEDGTYAPDPQAVPIARRVFEMRDEGASITDIRSMLRAHGDERSSRGVQVMLANRIYLGELHFGKLVNLHACEPIVDRDLFERVQRLKVPRGPKPKSKMLLARLGVLRCGSCGARMSSWMMSQGGGYPTYVCGSTSVCERHMVISAKIAEAVVVSAVRRALADVEGRAAIEDNAREAQQQLETAQDALNGAVRAFDGLGDVQATHERLTALRDIRDAAQARVDHLGSTGATVTVNGGEDWDRLSLDGQRALIRATVESAIVGPGRGAERITVRLVGE